MCSRELTLLEAEILRHEAMAMADPDRRGEHEEVAAALRQALAALREEKANENR